MKKSKPIISKDEIGNINKGSDNGKVQNIKPTSTIVSKVEKVGYKFANKLHKFGVLSLVLFITFNIGMFFKEYNAYWRARRKPEMLYDIEESNQRFTK